MKASAILTTILFLSSSSVLGQERNSRNGQGSAVASPNSGGTAPSSSNRRPVNGQRPINNGNNRNQARNAAVAGQTGPSVSSNSPAPASSSSTVGSNSSLTLEQIFYYTSLNTSSSSSGLCDVQNLVRSFFFKLHNTNPLTLRSRLHQI